MTTENEKAREAKRRSKDAFDGQAATYDEDMHGAHAPAPTVDRKSVVLGKECRL